MSIIYYYTKNENLVNYLKYGIRLSKNFDIELNISGYNKTFISGLLNPKDSMKKYRSNEYTCLKLDVLNIHCKVIDSSANYALKEQIDFIELDKYIFGTFKNPIVLIDTSIISNNISVLNKDIDIPVLYNNSEEFYYEVQISKIINEFPLNEIYTALKNAGKSN